MAGIRTGGRLKLSPKAADYYLKASKVHGGQTKLLENAVEYYVSQGAIDIQRQLSEIRFMMYQLAVHHGMDIGQLNQEMFQCGSQAEGGGII